MGNSKTIGGIFSSTPGHLFCLQGGFNEKKTQELLQFDFINGEVDELEALLNSGADPNVKNREGRTALTMAIQRGKEKCVKALLESQANPDLKDGEGMTPLIHAAMLGKYDCLILLLANGADRSLKASSHTVLMWAKICNHYECQEALRSQNHGDCLIS